MFFGTHYNDPDTGDRTLVFFHRSELKYYTSSNLFSRPGGLSIRSIRKLIQECQRTGKQYSISTGASMKLMRKGIY